MSVVSWETVHKHFLGAGANERLRDYFSVPLCKFYCWFIDYPISNAMWDWKGQILQQFVLLSIPQCMQKRIINGSAIKLMEDKFKFSEWFWLKYTGSNFKHIFKLAIFCPTDAQTLYIIVNIYLFIYFM